VSLPVLYGAGYSVYTRIARLALLEKGVEFRMEETDVFAPGGPGEAHLRRHPFGRIPAFEHGAVSLYEAGAIARYVDEAFAGPALQPADTAGRAQVAQIMSLLDSYGFRPLVYGVYVEQVVKPGRGQPADMTVVRAALEQSRTCLRALAALMGDAAFLAGSRLSLADTHAAPMVAKLRWPANGAEVLAEFPALLAWWRMMNSRPAMVATRVPGEPDEAAP
jgi:glutathione S-transferase